MISGHWPWPLNSGGSVAQFGWIEYLRQRHEITLLVPIQALAQQPAIDELRGLWPNVKLIPVMPDAAAVRLTPIATIKAVIRQLPVIKVAYHALARKLKPAPFGSGQLAELPKRVVETVAAEACRGYDLIHVEYVEMLSAIHLLPPEIPNLFCHLEIHYVMRDRGLDTASREDVYRGYLLAREKALELDTLRRYDALVTMSENDRQVLQTELPERDIYASPFAFVNAPGEQAAFRISEFANRLTYIGGSMHHPNVDAVRWFLEMMWPTLSARFPTLTFHIIGEWNEQMRQQYGSIRNVVFTGYVKDVSALLQGSIMVVPLRIGSGVRTKILMAMTLGVPVVTTPTGVEGIEASHQNEVLCAQDAGAFTESVALLVQNPARANRIAQNAHEFVQNHYSPDAAGARRDEIYHLVRARRTPAPASSPASNPA